MARNIAGYIANLGKSVAYSASDKVKNMAPSSAEFVSTNTELFKSVYSSIRNYKVTYKRGQDMFRKSKIYEASDVLFTSLQEDIRSGKFYNKEREDKMSMKMVTGSDSDNGFDGLDLSDFNFEDFGDFEADDYTSGDKIIAATTESSNRKSAEMISQVTMKTGEYIVESQKMNTNILYTQNIQGFSMLNSNLTSINENMSKMIEFSKDSIDLHFRNTADYYTKSMKLMEDQTALLREIVGVIKPEKKEDKSRERITYDDIVGASGTPDLNLYFEKIKKNIESIPGLGMLSSLNNSFGSDSNILAMLMTSPLKFIPDLVVDQFVNKNLENTVKNLDNSVGSLFGSLITKFNTMSKENNNALTNMIGNVFGIKISNKTDLDTSKYEKGKVDWDGKSRKALIEVIPTQLSKIISLLSGGEEKVYDYEKGRFIKAGTIKTEYDNKIKSYSKSASSDMREFFDKYIDLLAFDSLDDKKKLMEDIDKFFEKLYNDNRLFNINSKTLDEDHMDYNIDSKNFRIIRALFKNAPKHIQQSINNDNLNTKSKQLQEFEDLEKSGTSNFNYLFNGSDLNEFINKKKNGSIESNSLLSRGFDKIKDNYGKNIFYYLQNMYKELSFIRRYGTSSSANGAMPYMPSSMRIISSDGSTYSPEEKTINDIIIPRSNQYSESERQLVRERESRDKFRKSELKRIEKNQSLIKYYEIDDDRVLENHLSSLIKKDQIKEKLEFEKNRKKNIVEKLLESDSLEEKSKILLEKINNFTQKPSNFLTNIIENMDKRIYEFIYGREDDKGEIKGFLDLALYELKNTFNKFNKFLDDKILTPLKEKLDADSMKDVFKNLLNKMGIDVDHLSETIKSFFFGTKNTDGKREGGIFGETIEAIKQSGKNVFNFVKESFSDTFSPIISKVKDRFRSRNSVLFEDLDDENDIENNNNLEPRNSISRQFIDDNIINSYRTGLTQEYYDSLDWDQLEADTDISTRIKMLEANRRAYNGFNTSYEREFEKIMEMKTRMGELESSLDHSLPRTRDYYRNLAEYNRLDNDIKETYKLLSKVESESFELDNLIKDENRDTYNLSLFSSLKEMLKVNDEEDNYLSDIITRLLGNKSDELYGNEEYYKNLSVNDFITKANELSKYGDTKYKDIADKLLEYDNFFEKYYNFGSNNTLEKIIHNKDLYSEEERQDSRTAEELYNMFPNLINSSELLLEETSTYNNKQYDLLSKIVENIEIIKNNIINRSSSRPGRFGPRVNLNPELINNPEGRATYQYAQDLSTMIANWMYGNMPHYDEGGYISKPTVATVGEGEIVLSKENVDRLTSIFNELVVDVKEQRKSGKDIATTAFDKLLPMFKKGELKDLSVVDKILKENPDVYKHISSMDIDEKSKYDKIFKKLNTTLINTTKDGSELSPVEKALFNETKPFVEKMGEELVSGINSVKRSLFGDNEKVDRKNFGDMISDVTSNISRLAPKAIGAGVVGGGVSLLTGALGGPLLGAAVGAGVSLTKNSEGVQKFLFGELDNDGNRKENGLINKKTQDIFKQYFPDMAKLGVVGGLASLVTPLGPIAGMITGSAIGFAKNNKEFTDSLFGKEGVFSSKDKAKLEKLLPRIVLGAGIGALTGPFGLLGNILLGSGIGIASTTNSFSEAIFGKYNESTGEFESGLLPSMRKYIIDPLKENAEEYKKTFFDYMKEQIFKPVTSAIDPIRTEIAYMVKRPFEKLEEKIVEKMNESFAPLRDAIQDKFVKPLTTGAKAILGKLFKLSGSIISSPFKLVGKIGENLKLKQIAEGRADYLSAEERIDFRNEIAINSPRKFAKFIKKDKTQEMDTLLYNMSKNDPSKIYELSDTLNAINNSKRYMIGKRKALGKEIGDELGQYFVHGKTKKITEAISLGDRRKALGLIENLKMRSDIPEEKREYLIKSITAKIDEFEKFENTRENQNNLRKGMYDKLRELGIKDISDKNIKKYGKYLSNEVKYLNKNNEEEDNEVKNVDITPEQEYYKESIDLLKLIAQRLETSNEISEDNKTVTEQLSDSISREKSGESSNKNNTSVIEDMIESSSSEVDQYGNVIDLKTSSDGELEPDMTDASTRSAIEIAREDREIRNNFMNTIMNRTAGIFDKKENEDGEKENNGIFGLLSGVVPLLTKILNPKTIIGIATATMAAPGFLKILDAFNEGGLRGAIASIPVVLSESISKGVTEILPETTKGVFDVLENTGYENNDVLSNIKDTAIRQVITGGSMSLSPFAKLALKDTSLVERIGKNVSQLHAGKAIINTMNPLTYMKMGVGAAAEIPRVGLKLATKAGEKLSGGLYDKIGEKIGLKSLSSKISGAFKDKSANVINMTNKLSESVMTSSNLSTFLNKISENLVKLFGDKMIVNLLSDKIPKIQTEFIPKFINLLKNQLEKQGPKIAGKLMGAVSTGGVLNIVFAINDFISGFNNAKDILSIVDEPTLGMKFTCGVIKALNGLFIITSLIPENVYVDIVLEASKLIFNSNSEIQQMRAEAKQKVDKYKKENNIKGDFDVQDYNKLIREQNKQLNPSDRNGDGKVTFGEKILNVGSSVVNKIKDIGSNFINGVKNFFSIGKGDYVGKGGNSTSSRVNNFTYFSQKDNRWSYDKNSTMSKAGCGPTSLAMILSETLGRTITPDEISREAESQGLWNEKGSSSSLFGYFANKYNIPFSDAKKNWNIFDKLASEGIPQTVSGKGSAPYTSAGHIVTVLGKDGDGNYIVNDPLSIERSRSYTPFEMRSGWNNSWAFGGGNTQVISDQTMELPDIVGFGNGEKIKMFEKIIQYARAFKGKLKYSMDSAVRQWINKDKLGADCSSFTQHVYKTVAGIDIGANTGQQLTKNTRLSSVSEGQPGDLILFKGTYNSPHPEGVSHVGIISDNNGNMIDQGSSGAAPKERSYVEGYWKSKQLAAVRVLPNPNELVDPVVQGGNKAVGTVVGTSLGLNNSSSGTSTTNASGNEVVQEEPQQTGFDGFISDLGNMATSVINKLYKFDTVSTSSTTGLGIGGVDRDILPPVPMKQYDPSWNLDGQGGGYVKGIALGTKPLAAVYSKYDSIFNKAGAEFGVDPEWMKAISMQESSGVDITGKPARGIMQIENTLLEEFRAFGKKRGETWTEADRSVPERAIPFAADRLSYYTKHYNGDYLKATQAYNFSHYSLDKLLKKFPNGDDWLAQRANIALYNGHYERTGSMRYGDPKYIENVFRYYHGNQISSDGSGPISGGAVSTNSTSNTQQATTEPQQTGFEGFISDLGNMATSVINKIYGFDKIEQSESATESPVSVDNNGNMTFDSASGNTEKLSDEWFIGSLGARVSSPYGPRKHPTTGEYKQHTGIDYAAPGGTPILTPTAGKVISNISSNSGYGNYIKLKDFNNGIHLFAHMQEKSPLKVGQNVSAGQAIGKVGTTGTSTGNHLHYETRTSDKADAHTDPNVYWNNLSKVGNIVKSAPTTTKNGSNITLSSNNKNTNSSTLGIGGVDRPIIKSPKLPIQKPVTINNNMSTDKNVLDNSRLLAVIVEILHKIANNTSSLSDIVQLLSKTLKINIPEESLTEIKSNNTSVSEGNKQIVNIIKNSIQQNENKNVDNAYLLQTLEKFALE